MRLWVILALLLAAISWSGRIYRPSHPMAVYRPVVNLPLAVFWGIAETESDFDPLAISKDGADLGMWQLRSFYNRERGIKNPFDPVESTRWAAMNFGKNMAYFCNVDKAISSHLRGRAWVKRHGIDREYLRRVKGE